MIDEPKAGRPGLTMKQMCEYISRCWREGGLREATPEEIFNYSPTGELFMVFEWYWNCRQWEAGQLGGVAMDAYLADMEKMWGDR